MKKIVAAVGLWGLVSMLLSLEAMEKNYEIINGFSGMQRDIILKLCYWFGQDPAKVKGIIGMCGEHILWIKHNYFVKSRVKAVTQDTVSLAKSFGNKNCAEIKEINLDTLTIPYQDRSAVQFLKGLFMLKKPTNEQSRTLLNDATNLLAFDLSFDRDKRLNVYGVLMFLTQRGIGSDYALHILCCLPRWWRNRRKKLETDKEYHVELILIMKPLADIDYVEYSNGANDGTALDIIDKLAGYPDNMDLSEWRSFLKNVCKAHTYEEVLEKMFQ
ncbi:hypothetical protein FACS1894126_2230 [Alphaproteobacteria bacterium]|nr:hypothetical protein FACS1894126_2230 [Alphaproteobacteria bacterium]